MTTLAQLEACLSQGRYNDACNALSALGAPSAIRSALAIATGHRRSFGRASWVNREIEDAVANARNWIAQAQSAVAVASECRPSAGQVLQEVRS